MSHRTDETPAPEVEPVPVPAPVAEAPAPEPAPQKKAPANTNRSPFDRLKSRLKLSRKSPAMARLLRERIEKLIRPEDLLEIELQSKMRDTLKKQVVESKERSKLLYEILNNDKIKHALKQGNLVEAQELAMKLIEKMET